MNVKGGWLSKNNAFLNASVSIGMRKVNQMVISIEQQSKDIPPMMIMPFDDLCPMNQL